MEINNNFIALSGASPGISTSLSNLSYTSFDGQRIYLNFDDIDSAGLEPSSGLQLRFSVTKKFGSSIAGTVTPTATFIDSRTPKTVELIFADADKLVDSSYDGSGIALTAQTVFVSYDATSFGTTIPKLSDNDTQKSFVASFTGVGITNLTKEARPPLFNYSTTSTDGSKVFVYYTEATPPILPTTSISGFAISQNNVGIAVTNAYVLDPTSATLGKIVVLQLASGIAVSDGTNPVSLTYLPPASNLFKIRDSTGTGLTYAVALAGVAVTNLTSETIRPTVVNTQTSVSGLSFVQVVMSEVTQPGASATGFSVYDVGLGQYKSITSVTDGPATYNGIDVIQYDLLISDGISPTDTIVLSYSKPSTNYITDQSSNLNELANFSNRAITNRRRGVLPLSPGGLYSATAATTSYVSTNGSEIFLDFNLNKSYPALPGTGISGFQVFIDGQYSPVKSASTGSTGSDHNVKLTLYNKVAFGSSVEISLQNGNLQLFGGSGYGTIRNFEPVLILNNTTYDNFGFFDTKYWNTSLNNAETFGFTIEDDNVDVFVKSDFYPTASVIYDTRPPKGIVILNRNADDVDPGIKVHYFAGLGYSSITETQTDTLSDFSFTNLRAAIKITSPRNQNISTIILKLKKSGNILNLGDKINVALYTNDSVTDSPSTILGTFSSIQFNDLTSSYAEYTFSNTGISLTENTSYWIDIVIDNLPIAVSGTVSIDLATYSLVDNEIAYYDDTELSWIRLADKTAYNKITAFNTSSSELSSTDYLLDIFESPMKSVSVYGGSSDLSKFEVIGNEQSNYIYKKFDPVIVDEQDSSNNVYPTITNLVVGATAKNTKIYKCQIKETRTSEWVDLFENIADQETLDYLNFTFDIPTSLYAARLAYYGDYFTIDQRAEVTIAAYDEFSDVVSAQISRFSDFRDATNFPNADSRGFIDFSAGETTFQNVDLTNASYLWSKKTGNSTSEITAIATFNEKILIASNNKMFVYANGEVYEILNESLISEKYQITCIHIHNGIAYAGSNYGLLFASFNGEFWSVVNAKDPLSLSNYKLLKPILSLASLGNDLFIGSSKGATTECTIYKYDGKKISEIKSFSAYDKVTSLAAKEFTLFAGLGGEYASKSSAVYSYYNSTWTQTLSSNFDSVETLTRSVTRNSLLATFRGGQVWELSYTGSTAKTWSKIYDTYSDHVHFVYDDPNGSYVYVSADNGIYGYFKSVNGFKKIVSHNYLTSQLNTTWRSYTGAGITWTDIGDLESNNFIAYKNQTASINYNGGFATTITVPSGFTFPSVTFEGALLTSKAGDLSFKIDSSVGYNLFINDTLQISNYNTATTVTTKYSANAFSVEEGDILKFKLQTTNNVGTGTTLKLSWQRSIEESYQIVPAEQFLGVSKFKAVTSIGNTFYGASVDGSIYHFTPAPYENNDRTIYVRLKDEAGNIQGVSLPSKSSGFSVLNDKMVQTSNVGNNPSSFIQYTATSVVSNSNTTINPITGNTQNNQTNNPTQNQTDANTAPTNTIVNNTNNQNLSTTNNSGVIYQIQKNADNSLSRKGIYVPNSREYSIFAPDRKVREYGVYEPQPIYVPTLITWTQLVALVLNKYPTTTDSSLDFGTEVNIYIKTGNTRAECLASTYSEATSLSSINEPISVSNAQSLSVDLSPYSGKWIQYKVELVSASPNITPELLSLTLTYTSSSGSYFFTKMFDTTDYDTDAPLIKRGLLTSNELKNNGSIVYGYTTSEDSNETYNFENFNIITPNTTFELSEASSTIRFGIFLTSTGVVPAMVYDFAVQLDIGDAAIKFNPAP